MKKMLSITAYYIGLFFLITASDVWAVEQGKAAATLTALLSDFHTYQAKFKQTLYDDRNRLTQEDNGRVMIKRPGKLYWEVESPTKQITIINGSVLWVYDVELQQATKQSEEMSAGNPILLLSNSPEDIRKYFTVRMNSKPGDKSILFVLEPRSNSRINASQITLQFIAHDLVGLMFQDNLGQKHVLTFMDIQKNIPLSDRWFQFIAKNVDVIDNTTDQ